MHLVPVTTGSECWRVVRVESATRRGGVPALLWIVAAFTIAQLADLLTAQTVARELNPIAVRLGPFPILAFALKTALIAFVVAVAEISDGGHPSVARAVLVVGTIVGVLGALSNTHLSPFVSA